MYLIVDPKCVFHILCHTGNLARYLNNQLIESKLDELKAIPIHFRELRECSCSVLLRYDSTLPHLTVPYNLNTSHFTDGSYSILRLAKGQRGLLPNQLLVVLRHGNPDELQISSPGICNGEVLALLPAIGIHFGYPDISLDPTPC